MGIVRNRTSPRKESQVFKKWNWERTLGKYRFSLLGAEEASMGNKKWGP